MNMLRLLNLTGILKQYHQKSRLRNRISSHPQSKPDLIKCLIILKSGLSFHLVANHYYRHYGKLENEDCIG